MPAAAVIPAPIAYIKVVAVKKLVVGFTVPAVAVRRTFPTTCSFGLVLLNGRPRSSSRGGRLRGFLRIKAALLPGRKIVKNLSPIVRVKRPARVPSRAIRSFGRRRDVPSGYTCRINKCS